MQCGGLLEVSVHAPLLYILFPCPQCKVGQITVSFDSFNSGLTRELFVKLYQSHVTVAPILFFFSKDKTWNDKKSYKNKMSWFSENDYD